MLECLGISCLPQPLYGVGVPEKMRPDLFPQPRPLSSPLYDLPGPLSVYPKNPVVQAEFSVKGIRFKPVSEFIRAGNKPGLFIFPFI